MGNFKVFLKKETILEPKKIMGTEKQHEKFLKIARTAKTIMEKVF